ncbi:hypothetical protein C3489_11185 [Streptomyces sp. Ru71]|nr:hypothetical protein C3489_11185 [Streptomyces sp. Ru71]
MLAPPTPPSPWPPSPCTRRTSSPPPSESNAVTVTARLVIARHSQARCNVEGRVGGPKTCTGLTSTGHHQAHLLAAHLAAEAQGGGSVFDAVRAGTRPRVHETGTILAEALDLPLITDPGLDGPEHGDADGRSWREVEDAFQGSPDAQPQPPILWPPGRPWLVAGCPLLPGGRRCRVMGRACCTPGRQCWSGGAGWPGVSRPGQCGSQEPFDAVGEAGLGDGELHVGMAPVVAGDSLRDVVCQGDDAVAAAPGSGSGSRGEPAEGAQERGEAGVEADLLGWAGAGHRERVGVDGGLQLGLAAVEVRRVLFSAGLVVEEQGVAGQGVAVACGVLPPESGAVFDAGDVQGAAQ